MSDPQNNEPEQDEAEQDDAAQTDAQQADASEDGDQTLADADLEQPSTGYEPGEEPKSSVDDTEEPSHEAVGIGVVETPPLEGGDDA